MPSMFEFVVVVLAMGKALLMVGGIVASVCAVSWSARIAWQQLAQDASPATQGPQPNRG